MIFLIKKKCDIIFLPYRPPLLLMQISPVGPQLWAGFHYTDDSSHNNEQFPCCVLSSSPSEPLGLLSCHILMKGGRMPAVWYEWQLLFDSFFLKYIYTYIFFSFGGFFFIGILVTRHVKAISAPHWTTLCVNILRWHRFSNGLSPGLASSVLQSSFPSPHH